MNLIFCANGVLVIASKVEAIEDIRAYGTGRNTRLRTAGGVYETHLEPLQVLDLIDPPAPEPEPAEPEVDPNQPALELDFTQHGTYAGVELLDAPDEVVLPAIPVPRPPGKKAAAPAKKRAAK